MKQVSQDLSIEYGRYLRGEISLRDYAESTARNDVEVEEIVQGELHRVVRETHVAQMAEMRRRYLVRAIVLGIGACLWGGMWLFYLRALFPADHSWFDVIVLGVVVGCLVTCALAFRLVWITRARDQA